jgi:recombinational DNA repair ATPase RecF
VIPEVNQLSLAAVEGLDAAKTWAFDSRLNIVCGPSGSGKTRVLEALRQRTGTVAAILPPPEPCDFASMSFGQTVMGLGTILLDIQPEGTCLLMDDVLGSLDQENTEHLFHLLRMHGKQVILTVKPERQTGATCETHGREPYDGS